MCACVIYLFVHLFILFYAILIELISFILFRNYLVLYNYDIYIKKKYIYIYKYFFFSLFSDLIYFLI